MTNCPLKLLCVDDDFDIRLITEMALSLDPGISVHMAASAGEALAMLRSGTYRVDAILLDVMMPEMRGPDALAAIRSIPAYANVPVIFMTARARASDVANYRQAGAAGTIVKPFDPLALPAQVRALIEG